MAESAYLLYKCSKDGYITDMVEVSRRNWKHEPKTRVVPCCLCGMSVSVLCGVYGNYDKACIARKKFNNARVR